MAPQDDNADHQAHSPLIGGSFITTFIKGSQGTWGLGTLGFFASINNVPQYNNIVLVSNMHVLADHGAAKGDNVYQPSWKQVNGGWKENFQSNRVGVLRDLPAEQNHPYQYPGDPPNPNPPSYWVDCATALLDICVSPICHTNCGVKFSDTLRGLNLNGSSKITGVGRMTAADQGQPVYIVGAKSGVVQGTLQTAMYSDGTRMNRMEIVSDDSIDHGDSGSAVVDKNGLLVGLLHHSTGLGSSWACHIAPILDLLGVTPITAANEPDNPAFSGSAAQTAQAAAPATPGGMLRQRLSETEKGRHILALVEEHQSEVVHLVNHERAVTVAWHRNKGPQFLNEAAANLSDPQKSIPREIEGASRQMLLQRMAEALMKYGSRGLCETVERFLNEALSYVNRADSIREMVDLFNSARTA